MPSRSGRDRPWTRCSRRTWTGRAPWSSGSTCRSGCWRRAGARRTGPPAACSAPGAARSSRSRPGRSGRRPATPPRTCGAASSPVRASAPRRGACGPSCSRPTSTARRAGIRCMRCTRSWRSVPWREHRSRPASTPAPAATNGGGCWPGGIEIPAGTLAGLIGDVLDAAAVAWSARRIAAGRAVTVPDIPQSDSRGREIAIRF